LLPKPRMDRREPQGLVWDEVELILTVFEMTLFAPGRELVDGSGIIALAGWRAGK